ncbi:hypothetical protein BB559_004218 [Furculomyces boomerangus]|uniref:Roadblock/LAMTOR2 domain-containing protein n=2 Tax=Harpellales TaxID=61421 RepID=A0A2T9YA22_9FUNG|nr:hypothetical protein BB559_005218 [Furculomyces boomerangus]PVU91238.1 hypothetical protein BB559_004218 [Furculomyces boomerangus]PWA01915.1 hypothetical protein BB558_001938 [Smittium angustum]
MILQAKVLKNVLKQALSKNIQLCALFSDNGTLLAEAHIPELQFEDNQENKKFNNQNLLTNGNEMEDQNRSYFNGKQNESPNTTNYGSVNSGEGSQVMNLKNTVDLAGLEHGEYSNSSINPSVNDVEAMLLEKEFMISESIRGFLAIMATLWTNYEQMSYCVSAASDMPEYENNLNVLTIESKDKKVVVFGIKLYRLVLVGSNTISLGLLKAKASALKNYLEQSVYHTEHDY